MAARMEVYHYPHWIYLSIKSVHILTCQRAISAQYFTQTN